MFYTNCADQRYQQRLHRVGPYTTDFDKPRHNGRMCSKNYLMKHLQIVSEAKKKPPKFLISFIVCLPMSESF